MKKLFMIKDIAEPQQYLSTMLNNMDNSGKLCIAREIDELTFYTAETELDASHIEEVNLNISFADYDLLYNFYKNALSNIDLLLTKYSYQSNTNIYCRRMILFAKRVKRLIKLNAPDLVLRIEKCMLMDSIVLFKANGVGKIVKNKRVVFLDIDGVLNTPYSLNYCCDYIGIDDDKVWRLCKIVRRTDALIVLVSDWKRGWYRDIKMKSQQEPTATYLEKKLAKFGLEITDKTKDKSGSAYFSRGEGVVEYIKNNDVLSFAILDDSQFDYDSCDLKDHFVKMDPQVGLTNKDVEKTCRILLQ